MDTRRTLTPADLPPRSLPPLKQYRSWPRFHHGPRSEPAPLLAHAGRYARGVFVAGCQRSGTTILTRIIARSRGFQPFAFTHDDELDAALILCGRVELPVGPRYAFQTTYLNERYPEYATLRPDHRLVWVVRNPYSVVYSMLYNWRRFALNELYDSCTGGAVPRRAWRDWFSGPSLAEKASISYARKTTQIMAIRQLLGPEQVFVVEYDSMVRAPQEWLAAIFDFVGEPYDPAYAKAVRQDSLDKAMSMSKRVRSFVETLALPAYKESLRMLSKAPMASAST